MEWNFGSTSRSTRYEDHLDLVPDGSGDVRSEEVLNRGPIHRAQLGGIGDLGLQNARCADCVTPAAKADTSPALRARPRGLWPVPPSACTIQLTHRRLDALADLRSRPGCRPASWPVRQQGPGPQRAESPRCRGVQAAAVEWPAEPDPPPEWPPEPLLWTDLVGLKASYQVHWAACLSLAPACPTSALSAPTHENARCALPRAEGRLADDPPARLQGGEEVRRLVGGETIVVFVVLQIAFAAGGADGPAIVLCDRSELMEFA
jgi:hypothetical protein